MKILKMRVYWTTEQADDIYMLLDALKEAVWESYGADIIEMHRKIAGEQKEKEEEFTGFNDEIPF